MTFTQLYQILPRGIYQNLLQKSERSSDWINNFFMTEYTTMQTCKCKFLNCASKRRYKSKFFTKTCKMCRFCPFTKSLMIDDWWLKRENQGLRIKDRRIKQPFMSKGSEQSAWISECMIVRLVVWQMWPLWTQVLAILFLEGKHIREI